MSAVDSSLVEKLQEAAAASFPARPDGTRMSDDWLRRRMGIPGDAKADSKIDALVSLAREWYLQHGDPWASASVFAVEEITDAEVLLRGGAVLRSKLLERGLRVTKVRWIVVAGFSAGPAVEREIARLWAEEKPDEAQSLNSYAVALVEHLRLVGWRGLNERMDHVVLPHYSPGYEGWDLNDQRVLFDLLEDRGPLCLHDSLMLEPAKSMLTVYGIACPKTEDIGEGFWERFAVLPKPASPVEYSFGLKVLRKWAQKRLVLTPGADGEVLATFRIDGSTCANMGLPLALDYRLKLRRGEGDYVIEDGSCSPAEGDGGHRSTCLHLSDPDAFHRGAAEKPPVIGGLLSEVLSWKPDLSPAGCLCTRSSRDHKWSVVLQTLHFALDQNET